MKKKYLNPKLTMLHAGEQGMFEAALASNLLQDGAKGALEELGELLVVPGLTLPNADKARAGLLNFAAWAFTSGVSYAVAMLGREQDGKPARGSLLAAGGYFDAIRDRQRKKDE